MTERTPKTHDLVNQNTFRRCAVLDASDDRKTLRLQGDCHDVAQGDTLMLSLGLGGKPFTVEAINHTDDRSWFALARAAEPVAPEQYLKPPRQGSHAMGEAALEYLARAS